MALQIWIPFISDNHNQGLTDNQVTAGTCTYTTGGVLGNAATFNGSSNSQKISFNYTKQMTFAVFAKFNSFNCHLIDARDSSGNGYQPMYVTAAKVQAGGGSSFPDLACSLSTGRWYHICVVETGTMVKLYIDGEFVTEAAHTGLEGTSTLSLGTRYTGANWLNGQVNDLRVYDHALSVKEVKEISKCLVLHYKLSTDNITYIATDYSGFGYNGTYAGLTSTSMNTSTPRYDSAVTFTTGASKYILTPSINKTAIQNNFTVSWWSKTSNMHGKMAWGGDSGGNRLNLYPSTASTSGFCWNTGDGGGNPIKDNGGAVVKIAVYNNGAWHHYAMVGDGTNGKLYIDGIYRGQATTYKPLNSPTIFISGWDTGTNYRWDGQISDFRLYAKALSDSEILELYHTPASIDNKGNFYCGELKEE